MEVWEVNPYVRYMDQRRCSVSYERAVIAYDYRLFTVYSGTCRVEIGEETIELNKDSLIVFPPAMAYRLLFDERRPAVLYDINFSLSYLPGQAIPPDPPERFNAIEMPEKADQLLFAAPVVLHRVNQLCEEIGGLLLEYEEKKKNSDELCSSLLKAILIRILQVEESEPSQERNLTTEIARFLEANCREKIEAHQLGRMFGYHPFYLNRLFKERYGCTLHHYQMQCRIKRACSMLTGTRLSIKEIADSLGFTPGPYFSELFHAMQGMTPTQYRKSGQKN